MQVSFGSCFGSGINLFSLSFDLPFFCHTRMEEPIIGCKEIEFPEQDQCKEFEVINGEWYWRTWLTPAMSEGECVNKELGRYGCLFPGDFQHLSWHNDTYCRCMGGFPTYAWEWETGRWIGGQSRPLSWVSISSSSQYEYQSNALSFMMLENWLTAAIEDYFLYDLKSQILCENNVITVPLQAVVCDCLAEDSPKGVFFLSFFLFFYFFFSFFPISFRSFLFFSSYLTPQIPLATLAAQGSVLHQLVSQQHAVARPLLSRVPLLLQTSTPRV